MKNSRPPIIAVALIALLSVLFAGCGLTQGKQDAEAVLTKHFQALATNGINAAIADYGAPFFDKTPKAEWTKALTKLGDKLGAYQSYTVTSWRVFQNAGTIGAGTTVSLQCQVSYSKHSATENFTLFKSTGDSDYKIIAHTINSTALLTE